MKVLEIKTAHLERGREVHQITIKFIVVSHARQAKFSPNDLDVGGFPSDLNDCL